MSFITKRERVFNEYDLFDLPPRNEGKLKAYASCTDARAWSHFCSDKTEHLVEIIKRNNDTVRTKYVPTSVIVETLMVTKNAEISRLKLKIEEFQQLLAAYDQLDLSCDQKCEIANAHAAIKAANKELDEMCLELDLSDYTEVLDSEAFQTGKSRGDGDENITQRTYDMEEQEAYQNMETKSVQMDMKCTCEVATHIEDHRIDEMRDLIINKDAKLNAMKNTIAVFENDVCEPYYVYANIYTALEKIFGTLCQNDKYRQYLLLMIAGKDIRCIDIKGKILFKLKVLEKFCCALIAPCNQEFNPSGPVCDATCYRSEVDQINYALTSVEIAKNDSDNKRAHLVADIIQNEEMKEILSKESFGDKTDVEFIDGYVNHDYNIERENLARLKKLQVNYDELMMCYESLKHEKNILEIRCQKYEELEKEFDHLKVQIQEYNSLWNEKEHYRKRSVDLDTLKEQYLILTDETENLETQLKAETEINRTKCKALEELWNENLLLEKKLNDARLDFEKEKNNLICKLSEADFRIMCQGQQVKSLSLQIDRLLEQDSQTINARETEENSIALIDEVESHKDKIKSLKDILFFNEEEKQNLQQQFQEQLNLINDLKIEVEDWKSAYEKTIQRNEYLEKYTESLIEETRILSQDAEEKSQAVENLISVIDRKSQEIDKLISEAEKRKTENKFLLQQINNLRNNFDDSITALENEKTQALSSLQLAREESQGLLDKMKEYDQVSHSKSEVTESLDIQTETKKLLENQSIEATDENISLKVDLASHASSNSILLQDIQQLHEINKFALGNIHKLQDENKMYRSSIELKQIESSELKMKLTEFENLTERLQNLQLAYEKLIEEKENLENKLEQKCNELDSATRYLQLNRRKSDELLDKLQQSESAKEELLRLSEAYQTLIEEKHTLGKDFLEKKKQIDIMNKERQDLKKSCDELLVENKTLLNDINMKTEELKNLYEENLNLNNHIIFLEDNQLKTENDIKNLQEANAISQARLNSLQQENADLNSKIQNFETLQKGFHELQKSYDIMKDENKKHLNDLERLEKDNTELQRHSQTLMSHSEDLQNALISSRTELIKSATIPDYSYEDILNEIEKMRQEKFLNQKIIRELRDQIEKSDNMISELNENISDRDHRIAIMQNHINELNIEVKKLQNNLGDIVDFGEEMKDFNFQNMQSAKIMEAHHSKATHNMKMELAQLQQQNAKLEEQLSFTKIKSEESFQKSRSNAKRINRLEDERQIIVTDIKQLEMETVGDSTLGPNKCDIKDVLLSLDRIRNSIDSKNSKSLSLEQTILKVRTSSQLLLTKAEEAKVLVEKEKQKIISEKEDAIKDRQNMEIQLLDFKNKLEQQIATDRNVIKGLEATILNQKLVIDKFKNTTADYISRLKDELKNLKKLYEDSKGKMEELQTKLQNLSEDKNLQMQLLNKFKADFDMKFHEVSILQKELNDIKSKTVFHIETQTNYTCHSCDTETQTDEYLNLNVRKVVDRYIENNKCTQTGNKAGNKSFTENNSQSPNPQRRTELQTGFNEVQILTLNVEPTSDYMRDNISQKLQSFDIHLLEKYSISSSKNSSERNNDFGEAFVGTENDTNLIDIYNRQSIQTNSSKANADIDNLISGRESLKTSLCDEFINPDTNKNGINSSNSMISASQSGEVQEKDLFIIYKDSLNNHNNDNQEKATWSEIIVENVSVYPNKERSGDRDNQNMHNILILSEEGEKGEDDSVKLKLKIEMPRVDNESHSLINLTNNDKKSLDSYTVGYYSTSRKLISTTDTKTNDDENSGKTHSIATLSNKQSFYLNEESKEHSIPLQMVTIDSENHISAKKHRISGEKSKSHHKLSRVEATVLLVSNDKYNKTLNSLKQKATNFGLHYVMDTVQAETNPNVCRGISKEIRAVKSEEVLNTLRVGKPDFSPSIINNDKSIHPGHKTIATNNKISNKVKNTFTDKAILVNMNTNSEYENTIKSLTKALENIEKDYKKKIEAIKVQYDNNIKSIMNEHNQGVKSIQYLHEDTIKDIINTHENEVDNLRSMSIEAMRKADLLEKENHILKTKVRDSGIIYLDEEPTKMIAPGVKSRKKRRESRLLTKTRVEAFDVEPKPRSRAQGPCTCTLDINLSDTIRNIFEQVDVEQRKMAENTYLKYVAHKILSGNIENLDAQELSFLHLKVCRIWKNKLNKEEALQKRIDSLEMELMHKQRNTEQHFAELDRKVVEERRRLQVAREAVCRNSGQGSSRAASPGSETTSYKPFCTQALGSTTYTCNTNTAHMGVSVRGSAGDLAAANFDSIPRHTIMRHDNNNDRAVLAKLDQEGRREKRIYNDEPPTRLRRSHDRQMRIKK